MKNNEFMKNINANPYFQTLPLMVQETIKQSGVNFQDEQELKNCAEQIMHQQ